MTRREIEYMIVAREMNFTRALRSGDTISQLPRTVQRDDLMRRSEALVEQLDREIERLRGERMATA